MRELTERQRQILEFITESITVRGYSPTLREIGQQMGIKSTNGVNDHLKALERKGFLERDDLKSRTLRPVGLGDELDLIEIPVLGRVAAGEPILAVEDAQDSVKIDRCLLGSSQGVYGLRIVGDSMIDDGIFDGDYVFVKKTMIAEQGEIVIAMIDNEATCKRYFLEQDAIRLQPANENMEPIFIRREDFRQTMILGKVVGVFRKM